MKNVAAIGLFAILLGSSTALPADSRDRRSPTPPPETTKAASPAPAATPTPKKRSFLQKLNPFGGKPKATPTPEAKPTPKPEIKKTEPAQPKATPSKKKRRVPADEDATPTPKPRTKKDVPEETPTPTPRPKATPRPTATPKETPTPKSTPTAAVAPVLETEDPTPAPAKVAATPIFAPGIDDEAIGKARYRATKIQALQDPAIAKLQDKADNAKDEDSQRSETKAYYRALFDKMRTLDPSIKPRIDRMEAATLKRLQSMTATQGAE